MVNTANPNIKNDNYSDKFDEPTLDSPTKSIITQSTSNATMVNYSPTKSTFSLTSDNNSSNDVNKDLFRINDNENILPTAEMVQQQSLAYPKMEINMSNLMIPNHSDSRTQSIYIKEPSLR